MAERFWENLSIILTERNISWIELTRKMFAGEFHYPSELNRLYQKIVSLHAQSSTKADAMKKLRTKKTLMESQKVGEQQKLARTGIYLEKVGHVLESNIDEAEELLKTMTETGDKLFQTVFLIGVFGQDEEELKQALDTIQQVAGSNDLMIDKLPYMLVVGQQEEADETVSVRSRFAGDEGQKNLETFIADIQKEIADRVKREVVKEEN